MALFKRDRPPGHVGAVIINDGQVILRIVAIEMHNGAIVFKARGMHGPSPEIPVRELCINDIDGRRVLSCFVDQEATVPAMTAHGTVSLDIPYIIAWSHYPGAQREWDQRTD